MRRKRRVRRRLAAAGIVLTLVGVAPAGAHPVLLRSEPRQGARVVEPPDVVVLEYSEPVRAVDVTVISPEGHDVSHSSAPEEADRTVRQGVGPLPEQGSYTVRYQVMSHDGHTVTGEVTFDYAGAPVEADEERPDDEASSDSPASDEPGSPEPTDERVLLRLWPLGLLVVAAAVGIAVTVRAFRRTRTPADDR